MIYKLWTSAHRHLFCSYLFVCCVLNMESECILSMDRDDPVTILIEKFTEDLLSFVGVSRRDPPLPREHNSQDSPSSPFEESVAMVVIGLIKGDMKCHIIDKVFQLRGGVHSCETLKETLRKYREPFFRNNKCNLMDVLKVIAFTIMFPFYIYLEEKSYAQLFVLIELNHFLGSLEDGQFVREGGLHKLNDFATNLFQSDDSLRSWYQEGTYPF